MGSDAAFPANGSPARNSLSISISEPVANSENSVEPPSTTARAVDFEHSRELGAFLEQLGVRLLVSTYQAGKLVAASGVDGQLQLTFHNFESPMGLAANGKRVWVGCKTQVWELTNAPQIARQLPPVGRHDACYLTRRAHVTGNLQGHELAWTGGKLWIVNTLFSCLCTLSADYSFAPRWRPPFISGLAAEDRCHLNGLAFDANGVRYVTALGQTDEPGGWRPNKAAGGVWIEVPSGRCLLQRFCMPHSPRLHAGAVWLLDSGRGAVVRKHLPEEIISAVNYSEILKKTIERGGSAKMAQAFVRNISLRIIPCDEEQAVASAALYPKTKPHGLSFADRACLALGVLKGCPVLTTDKDLALVDVPIKVRMIRGQH